MPLKDSGEREDFITGSVRDNPAGKGRMDLLPYFGILAIANQMERGAEKYGLRNWEKGQPLMRFLQSAANHLHKEMAGFDDEPHLDAALWNLACYAEGVERIKRGLWPAELDDRPKTYAGQDPEQPACDAGAQAAGNYYHNRFSQSFTPVPSVFIPKDAEV